MPTATKLMNSKRRVIYQSDRGVFYVKEGDKKLYGIKAHFKKMGKGPKRLTPNMTDNVPLAIRPSKRGAPKGPREGKILRNMNTESKKKKKSFRIVSPGGTSYKTEREKNIAMFLRRMTQNKYSPP